MNSRRYCPAYSRQVLQQCDRLDSWAHQHSEANIYLAGQVKSNCRYLRQSMNHARWRTIPFSEAWIQVDEALAAAKYFFDRLLTSYGRKR